METLRETIVFNVGGVRFETYKSTIQKQPGLLFSDDRLLQRHFRKNEGDYFFDRDPDMFKVKNLTNTFTMYVSMHV